MSEPGSRSIVVLAIAGVIAVVAWNFRHLLVLEPDSTSITDPVQLVEPDPVYSAPRHLIEPEPVRDRETGELVALPALDDSDAWFLLALGDLFGSDTGSVFLRESLIDRIVATIDSLPRSHTPEIIRPVSRLGEPFRSVQDGNTILLGPENFARYDALVARIAAANPNDIVLTYRRFYPLFQESYQRLGYPNAYFNDRVVEVIDQLLATPEPDGPVLLTQPNVLYEFADPKLESLSSGQKLLLRMGNANAATVKQSLQELRARIAQPT